MGDDLLMLGVVVIAAGAGFYLLTKDGNFNLGPADADVSGGDADVTGDGTGTVDPSDPAFKQSCSQLCQAGNCAVHAAKYCSGCSKCPNALGKSAQCAAWCKAVNCVQYRSQCNGSCSNCPTSRKCAACRKGYEHRGPGCTCYLKAGATPQTFGPKQAGCPTGYELRPRTDIPSQLGCYPVSNLAHVHQAYTGRVTFNQSAPIQNPNSIPMSTYKPAPSQSMSMRSRLF